MTLSPDLLAWRADLTRPAGPLNGLARATQQRINKLIPEKVHAAITAAIEGMTRAMLVGSDFTTGSPLIGLTLDERRARAAKAIDGWKKAAAAEGGITGFGGFLAAAADFPLLMSFKIKLLFEIAAVFGHDGTALPERLFILHIFELAFSDGQHRAGCWRPWTTGTREPIRPTWTTSTGGPSSSSTATTSISRNWPSSSPWSARRWGRSSTGGWSNAWAIRR